MGGIGELLRNEVEIELGGETRVMRATFAAIRAIEKDLDKGIVAIISEFGIGNITLTNLASIIFRGLRGADDGRLSLDEVGNALMETGIEKPSIAVVEFLGKALNGVSLGKPEAVKAPA